MSARLSKRVEALEQAQRNRQPWHVTAGVDPITDAGLILDVMLGLDEVTGDSSHDALELAELAGANRGAAISHVQVLIAA